MDRLDGRDKLPSAGLNKLDIQFDSSGRFDTDDDFTVGGTGCE